MIVKVLGLLGSPRTGGNTEILLDRALEGAASSGASVRKLSVCDYDISGCIECNDCYDSGTCTIIDDMKVIYDAIEESDRIILASPMFFMSVTAQTKAVIDRCQCYWALKYLLKAKLPRSPGSPDRLGSFIAVGGTRGKNLFEGAKLTVKYFFDAISVKPREDLYVLVRGVDDKGEILEKVEALEAAYASGKKLAEL